MEAVAERRATDAAYVGIDALKLSAGMLERGRSVEVGLYFLEHGLVDRARFVVIRVRFDLVCAELQHMGDAQAGPWA